MWTSPWSSFVAIEGWEEEGSSWVITAGAVAHIWAQHIWSTKAWEQGGTCKVYVESFPPRLVVTMSVAVLG